MNEFQVSDYGIFNNAISTIQKLNTSIESGKTQITDAKTRLSDGSIYFGPVADEATNGCTQADSKTTTMMSNMDKLAALLTGTSANYQDADKKASETVTTVDTTNLNTDIAAKKKAFIGNVDDPTEYANVRQGNYKLWKNHMRMFDNTTGEEIPEDGTITLKKGETRVITVKLPTNTGMIQQVVRTTAADTSNKGNNYSDTNKITSSLSDIDPDPNKVDYVNVYNWSTHNIPKDKSLMHTNYYDWIITADKVGSREISQTCEYETDLAKGFYFKAMVGLNVNIVDDDTITTK